MLWLHQWNWYHLLISTNAKVERLWQTCSSHRNKRKLWFSKNICEISILEMPETSKAHFQVRLNIVPSPFYYLFTLKEELLDNMQANMFGFAFQWLPTEGSDCLGGLNKQSICNVIEEILANRAWNCSINQQEQPPLFVHGSGADCAHGDSINLWKL